MELLEHDLHAEIYYQERRIPPEQAAKFLRQIISGLLHMHSLNLIHRDIKPNNIFITAKKTKLEISRNNGKGQGRWIHLRNRKLHALWHVEWKDTNGQQGWHMGNRLRLATRHN